MKQHIRWFFLSLLLTSCGFHFRGMPQIPIDLQKKTAVINQGSPQLGRILTQALNQNLSFPPADAAYRLFIDKDDIQQQLTSVGASTNPRQYLLQYSVQFHFTAANGHILLPNGHVLILRQLTINNERILGSDNEAKTIIEEMRQEATKQIILQISSKYTHRT